jgi:ABC-type transporter Mla MlaB component
VPPRARSARRLNDFEAARYVLTRGTPVASVSGVGRGEPYSRYERLEAVAYTRLDGEADRSAMLRITVEQSPSQIRLKLEGDLAGAWVAELEDCWRSAHSTLDGRPLCLDLSAVEQVDRAGRYLLALLGRNGAQLIASGAMMTELVRTLAGDWPLTEA